ncbi:hypothetical protein C4J81_01100 [Deltaproteobacteria bacterium Smac51]|nr:hypothetical protein C4J81_01100 [Deltaproteobacteria bacterium Smac51]
MKKTQNINSKKPGRPKATPQTAAPREELLNAAAYLFSKNGMAATSLAKVAAEAGLTSAMIHYYFKNKEQLIEAVAEERLACFLRLVLSDEKPDGNTDLEVFFDALLHRLSRACVTHPWIPQLWLREIITEGGGLRSHLLKHLPLDLFREVSALYRQRQADGQYPEDIEPALLFLTTISSFMLPLAIGDMIKQLPGIECVEPEQLAEHASAVVRHGFFGRTKD